MEFVYVVKLYDLFNFDKSIPHGFQFLDDDGGYPYHYLERIKTKGFFVERKHAENDCLFKQIIPYTLVAYGSEEIFLLKRSNKVVESRLRGRSSIGIGGHINPEDSGACSLRTCALRELHEELYLPSNVEPKLIGIVNDDSDLVGSVHFGLVYLLRLDGRFATIREKDQLTGDFVSVDWVKVMANDGRCETWTSLIARRLDEIVTK